MKHISYPKFIEFNGYHYSVGHYDDGIYTPIINKIIDQLEAFNSHHKKMLVFRLDLHQKKIGFKPANELMTSFFTQFKNLLKKGKKLTMLGYCWVREQNKSTSPHYHLVLMVDGQKHQHPKYLIDDARTVWESLDGTIYDPSRHYNIRKDRHKEIGEMIVAVLYLAKVWTKDNRNRALTANDYSTSRI